MGTAGTVPMLQYLSSALSLNPLKVTYLKQSLAPSKILYVL
jgi:hypothetical protein